MTLYQLLGVDASVGGAQLGRAYRRRLRQLHPDARSTADAAGPRLEITAELAAVQHAYQVLRDPSRRARYDAELRVRAADSSASAERRQASTPVPVAVRVTRTKPSEPPLIRVGPVVYVRRSLSSNQIRLPP